MSTLIALPVCQKLICSSLLKTNVEMWLRAEIVGIIIFFKFPPFFSFSISDIFIEFCSSKPQAEILFSWRRQPSELRISPKSLAIALIYVPAEHSILTSIGNIF